MSVPCPYNVQFDDVTFRCSREYGHSLCHTFHNESRDFEKVKKHLDDGAIYKELCDAEDAYAEASASRLLDDNPTDIEKAALRLNKAREAVRNLRGE